MQLYALDENRLIVASSAKRHKNYCCPECLGFLRLRGGPLKVLHFYHVQTPKKCSLSKKSALHIRLQLLLKELLPQGEVFIEKTFPEISRIADVFWETQKIVFEIQCSKLSSKEAKQRTDDYTKIGVRLVWILHDKRFNKKMASEAEFLLRQNTCYFTNIDSSGKGIIYDQVEKFYHTKRLWKSPPYKVNLTLPQKKQINKRGWTTHFSGDWIDRSSHVDHLEQPLISKSKFFFWKTFFQLILEAIGK